MAKKILIAPMDWGLGHTSRCIPLAQHYHSQGHHIFFAGNALQQQLFTASCPFVTTLDLDGYRISYPQEGRHFMLKMAMQLPRLQQTITREQQWLRQQMQHHAFDVILSDNRYGLYHPAAQSILLTHQLHIQTGSRLGNSIIRHRTQQLINRFDACWVVDDAHIRLAGILSDPISLKIPARYIGWLSQFQLKAYISPHPLQGHPYVLAVLSGPEPMRTQLEALFLKQMKALPGQQFIMTGGTLHQPGHVPDNVRYIPLAGSQEMYTYLQHADSVISRSGYSTVMDVICMQRPALFIPTPGQTEQELIARTLQAKKWFQCSSQDKLDIAALPVLPYTAPAFRSDIPDL